MTITAGNHRGAVYLKVDTDREQMRAQRIMAMSRFSDVQVESDENGSTLTVVDGPHDNPPQSLTGYIVQLLMLEAMANDEAPRETAKRVLDRLEREDFNVAAPLDAEERRPVNVRLLE